MSNAVRTKKQVFDALRLHADKIKSLGVKRLGVFGSFVRGRPNAESDVDFLVHFKPEKKTFDNFMGLSFFLEELLGRRVELVTRDALSPYIGPHILREVEYASLANRVPSAHSRRGKVSHSPKRRPRQRAVFRR